MFELFEFDGQTILDLNQATFFRKHSKDGDGFI